MVGQLNQVFMSLLANVVDSVALNDTEGSLFVKVKKGQPLNCPFINLKRVMN